MSENVVDKKEYTFKVTGVNGQEVESNRLKIAKGGFVDQFNRYGLCPTDSEKDYQNFDLDPKLPLLLGENYQYCRRYITNGYIYQYIDKIKKIFEYKVVAGILHQGTIYSWDKTTPDLREIKATADATNNLLLLKKSVYWFAYSTVQWASGYVQSMIDDQNLREERFQKLNTNDLETNKDVSFYDTISIYQEEKIDPKKPIHVNDMTLEQIANHNHELRQGYISNDIRNVYPYFSLHDPIGCANDMRYYNLKATDNLTTVITKLSHSLEAGGSQADDDFGYLHHHAVTFYKMFYGKSATSAENKKAIEAMQEKLASKEFFEKILLVQKRQLLRQHISTSRATLLQVVDSEYYLSVIDDILACHPIEKENNGIKQIASHLLGIGTDGNSLDKHMDIKDTSCPFKKNAITYLTKIIEDGHKIDQVLSQSYDAACLIDLNRDITSNKSMTEEDWDKADENMDEIVSTFDLVWANITNIGIALLGLAGEKKEAKKGEVTPIHEPNIQTPRTQPYDIDISTKQQELEGILTSKNEQTTISKTGKAEPYKPPQGVELVKTNKGGNALVIPEKWLNKLDIKSLTVKGPRGGVNTSKYFVFDKISLVQLLENMHCIATEKFKGGWGRGSKGITGLPTRRIADIRGKYVGAYIPNDKNLVLHVDFDEIAYNKALEEQTKIIRERAATQAQLDDIAAGVKRAEINEIQKLKAEAIAQTEALNEAERELARISQTKNAAGLAAVENVAKWQRNLNRIFQSKTLMGLTSFVSAMNFVATINSSDFENKLIRSTVSTVAATTELAQFTLNFIQLQYEIGTTAAETLKIYSGYAGVAANIAIGIVNVIDGITAIRENNSLAGLAYLGSAVGFFAAAGISWGMLLATPPVWARNGYLIAAYVVAVGFMLLAIKLTHTPLERYFANCILQEDAMDAINWQTMENEELLMYELYKKRNDIISGSVKEWRDLKESFKTFQLLLMNMGVDEKLTIADPPKLTLIQKVFRANIGLYNQKLIELNITCSFDTLSFDSIPDYALRIFYSKPEDSLTLYCKDLDGFFTETPTGYTLKYNNYAIENALPYTYKAQVAYFFQRIVYKNGTTYPSPNKEGEAVYFAQRIHFDGERIVYSSDPGTALALMVMNGSEKRAPMTLQQIETIIVNEVPGRKLIK